MRRTLPSTLLLLLAALALPAPAAAAEPKGFEYYHTYAEVKQLIDQTVAAHPTIAKRFNIGKSYQGRKIWGIKISDNVKKNENEPEVFIDAQIHARERASGELALAIIGWLTNNYGRKDALGQRVTNIVNSREIFIVPVVNPDGAEFDMKGGKWHQWRKNRQPTPNPKQIGIDLNRQFSYKWGCCGGGSNKPKSKNYRGTAPFIAPEAKAYRKFVKSRVKKGVQQIKVILSLHSAGRLVLWPYSYTKKSLPPDMAPDDYKAFVALGTQMAQMNGYKPMQASKLYIVDGDQDDWAYHQWGIFAFAFEMKKGAKKRYYPTQAELTADINNNRTAVLHLLEQADCPYRSAGLEAKHC